MQTVKKRLAIPGTRSARILLILLLTTDLIFIALHVSYQWTGQPRHPHFSLSQDRGYSEIFQFVKEFWIATLLFYCAIAGKRALPAAWGMFFSFLLADDALLLHEHLSKKLDGYVGFVPMLGFRGQDFAELAILIPAGILLTAVIFLAYYISDKASRRDYSGFFYILALLVFFGGFMDMIHSLAASKVVAILFGTLEDGGEMVVVSLAAWLSFRHATEEPEV